MNTYWYDYMANGNLSKPLRDPSKSALSSDQRHQIIKGVAARGLGAGRDIKASNVLLNARDEQVWLFRLARMYDHSENPETTRVARTVGYIAEACAQRQGDSHH